MTYTIDSESDAYFIRDESGKIVADNLTTRQEVEEKKKELEDET